MSTWLLLRGWAREARHWGHFLPLFRAAVQPARVLALDLPGSGELRAQASPLAVARIVERLRHALDERAVRPPYSLLGLSFGGMVAIDWATRHAAEVERCALLGTSARPFCAVYERLRWAALGSIAKILLTRDIAARERAILALVSSDEQRRQDALGAWIRIAEDGGIRFANTLRQLVAAARYRAPTRPPDMPVLLLAGRGDRLVDRRCSENLARAWRVPLRAHPTAGHDLALDAGAWVVDEVAAWLRHG